MRNVVSRIFHTFCIWYKFHFVTARFLCKKTKKTGSHLTSFPIPSVIAAILQWNFKI